MYYLPLPAPPDDELLLLPPPAPPPDDAPPEVMLPAPPPPPVLVELPPPAADGPPTADPPVAEGGGGPWPGAAAKTRWLTSIVAPIAEIDAKSIAVTIPVITVFCLLLFLLIIRHAFII